MHPAFSVIFFTVTSGTGYGVLVFLALISLLNLEIFFDVNNNHIFAISTLIGLVMVALGLMSSSFHLANKKNAWRAFFRFKSSWLSKEAVFAVISFPVALLFIISFYFVANPLLTQIFAILTIILALITVYSTGMIYGCLKTIRAWNTPLVPFNYILLGLISGNLVLMSIFSYYAVGSAALEIALMILLIIGFISKVIYYRYLGEPSPWSVKQATNLPGTTVRLLDTGESAAGANFLTKEFGFVIGKNTQMVLRVLALFMMFVVPSLIFFNAHIAFGALLVFAIFNYLGTMVERWLFFAEAKHVVNLFYGREA
jgi:DMSO reductase anchor subunit